MKRYLEAGKIVRTHGVRGELCLEPWADSAEFLRQVKEFYFDEEGRRPAGLVGSRVHKGRLLVTLEGVDTVEKGDALEAGCSGWTGRRSAWKRAGSSSRTSLACGPWTASPGRNMGPWPKC